MSTSSAEVSSLKPFDVKSSLNGATTSSGYMLYFYVKVFNNMVKNKFKMLKFLKTYLLFWKKSFNIILHSFSSTDEITTVFG